MRRLDSLLTRGLDVTAPLWPDIQTAYAWVYRATQVLANDEGQSAAAVRQAYEALRADMAQHRDEAGVLVPAVDHFLKVTTSYWPGLFHCYTVPDLPRTNNDLEQYFGAARHHERRATGRKSASPALVVRGAVRVVAAVATRLHPWSAADLCPPDLAQWRALRQALEYRHEARRAQRRFRRDSTAYLTELEDLLLQLSLPS